LRLPYQCQLFCQTIFKNKKNIFSNLFLGEEPLPEGLFWLLMTGDVPSEAQASFLFSSILQPHHIADFFVCLFT